MNTYLVDTSVIIDYIRGKKEAIQLLNSLEGEITSSHICLAELYEGIFRSIKPQKAEDIVIHFFNSLRTIFPVDEKVAKQFGELRATLKKDGNIIEDMDLLIGATCLVYNLILITYNKKHFTHIPNLKMYSA